MRITRLSTSTRVEQLVDDPAVLKLCATRGLATLGDIDDFLRLAFAGERLKFAVIDQVDANQIRDAFAEFVKGIRRDRL